MRKMKHAGFVLLIILIFLQLFALISAQYLWSKARFKQYLKFQLEALTAHDKALQLLTSWHVEHPDCQPAHYSSRFLLRQPESWWQLHACYQLSEWHAYGLWEDIMTDPCAAVSSAPQQRVHYYRLTIFIGGVAGAIVQETFAGRDAQPVDCRQVIRLVSPGRQSLRWLR